MLTKYFRVKGNLSRYTKYINLANISNQSNEKMIFSSKISFQINNSFNQTSAINESSLKLQPIQLNKKIILISEIQSRKNNPIWTFENIVKHIETQSFDSMLHSDLHFKSIQINSIRR